MRALYPGQARSDSGRSLDSPITDYKVVVLGVMYPQVFSSQQPSDVASEDAAYLIHDLTMVRQHTAVIFYDPFSPDGIEELKKFRQSGGNGRNRQKPRCQKAAMGRQETRRESIQAVVSELARLSGRNQDHEKG